MGLKLFDRAVLDELGQLDPNSAAGLVNDLIELFEKSVHEDLNDMKRAITVKDLKSLGRIAHTLKASSGNIGAVEFSLTCEKIERIAMYKPGEVPTEGQRLVCHLENILPDTLSILCAQKLN